MSLSTTESLQTYLQIDATTELPSLQAYLDAADGAIKKYCGWALESSARTEFYSGNNRADLLLRCRQVTAVASVYLDATGYYGDGTSAFGSTTLLTVGSDYVLVRDDMTTGTVGASGILRRIGSIPTTGIISGIVYPSGQRRGTLSGFDRAAVWPIGDGNIKVTYTAGYSTIPGDLEAACNMLAAQIRSAREQGRPMQSENFIDYSYQLLTNTKFAELSEVRSLLAPYREILR